LYEVIKHIPLIDQSRLDDMRNNLSPLPCCYIVEIDEVRSLLSKVEINKSVGPDGISHKILRELANYIAALVAAITFLPREATRSAVLPWHVVRLSVCPSVRL